MGLLPVTIDRREPAIRGLAAELIDGFSDCGECEFVSEFAQVFPICVFLDLVQLPRSDRHFLVTIAKKVIGGRTPAIRQEGIEALMAYILLSHATRFLALHPSHRRELVDHLGDSAFMYNATQELLRRQNTNPPSISTWYSKPVLRHPVKIETIDGLYMASASAEGVGSWIDIEACSALLAVKLAEAERGHLLHRRT
jgi:hypothetical protein